MVEKSKTFSDLIVWKKAHDFVLGVYKETSSFPKSEIYGLTSQFRRAAVSIPANIAEGFIKRGKLDKVRFYNIAQGSIEECKYYCILSNDLGYPINPALVQNINDVGKLLDSYINGILRSE
jgi:four helix bundle protein